MAQGGDRCPNRLFVAIGTVVVLGTIVLLLIQYKHPPPRYYACILSISAIDNSTNLEFNLSLGIQCRKPLWGRTCLAGGTDVAVAYPGILIAYAATGGEVCSGWYKATWVYGTTTVVARTNKAGGLPSSVVDGVIADTKRGVAVFYVTFRIQSEHDDDVKLVTCLLRPLSGKSVTPCDVQ